MCSFCRFYYLSSFLPKKGYKNTVDKRVSHIFFVKYIFSLRYVDDVRYTQMSHLAKHALWK